MINESLAKEELMRRLISLEYADVPALEIIEDYRGELNQQREEEARQARAMAENSTVRFARVEQAQRYIESINRFDIVDKVAELITVRQSELADFCKANGVNIDELRDALAHHRKEAMGAHGKRYQAYPLLYNENSEAGNREAMDELIQDVKNDEEYARQRASNKTRGTLATLPPLSTFFSKR